MIDLHCHILPGLDDGPKTWEESLQMARIACEDGITTLVATPHFWPQKYEPTKKEILDKTSELNRLLTEEKIDVQILPGASIHLHEGLIEGVRRGDLLTLNDTGKYVLLEIPYESVPNMTALLFRLELAGIKPILARPERNQEIQKSPSLLEGLCRRGCLLQTTASSFLGTFGDKAKLCARTLLWEKEAMLFVATDAHSARKRPPKLTTALKRIGNMFFFHINTEALVLDNPQAVIEGKEIKKSK
jgi:protein-tyrosine phosphatase